MQVILLGILKFVFGQWNLIINQEDGNYRFENPHPDDPKWLRWFAVVVGAYSAPMIDPEPTLAFNVPGTPKFVGTDGKTKHGFGFEEAPMVSGLICHGGLRGSLTNLKLKGHSYTPREDGCAVDVNGETWWITHLFHKDAQRFTPYKFDAILSRQQPDKVVVLELGDLPDILLPAAA